MIRPIDIKLNAAHPELPLVEATTFTGAPSSVFIRGVPKSVGNWSITAVNVAATYPDNSTTTRAAVESAEGVWVATIPGTATSGRTAAGFKIMADGIDENGAAVTGYVLGFADFAVLSFFPVPAPGETFFYLRYFDTMPTTAKKMDVTTIDGILKYYNGTTWLPFADLTNYYTKAETDDAIDKLAAYYITADAQGNPFATHAALVNAQTYYSGGAVRIPTRNDYAVVSADETHGGAEWRYIYAIPDGETVGQWEAQYPIETNDYTALSNKPQINGNTLTGNKTSAQLNLQDALTAQQLANIAAVSDALAFDATHSYAAGDPVVYNGTLYTFTAAHTGAWTGSDVSAVDIIARLAGKLDKSGGTMAGDINLGFYYLHSSQGQLDQYIGPGYVYINTDGSHMHSPEFQIFFPWKDGTFALLQDIAPDFSASSTYALNALCVYEGVLYICTTAVTTAGAWTGSTNWTEASVEDVLAALRTAIAGKADVSAIPYAIGTPTVIDTASSETVEGETVNYGVATLVNRTANIVQVTETLDELRITFPAATSGKVRDFGLRVEIGTGSAALAAPALVPIAPTGETIKIENNAKEIPALADGTATAKGVTLLYFSETAPGVFVVKGEQVEEVA